MKSFVRTICLASLLFASSACAPQTENDQSFKSGEVVQKDESCSYDFLLPQANSFKTQFARGELQSLEQDFGYDKDLAAYARSLMFQLQDDAIDPGEFEAWEINLLGHYEFGELVLFLNPAQSSKIADEGFLQRGKFKDFLVCHFDCLAHERWRLSRQTCFEETGEPFHGDY